MEVTAPRPVQTNWSPLAVFAAYGTSFFLPVTLGEGSWPTEANAFATISQLFSNSGEYFVLVFPIVFGPNLLFLIGLCCLHYRARVAAAVFGLLGLCNALWVGWMAVRYTDEPGLSLGPGFYLWVASMLALVFAGLFPALGRALGSQRVPAPDSV